MVLPFISKKAFIPCLCGEVVAEYDEGLHFTARTNLSRIQCLGLAKQLIPAFHGAMIRIIKWTCFFVPA